MTAKEHYRAGANAYKRGEHDKAIRHFEDAYQLSPDGMLLYNLSLAHAKAGHLEDALSLGEQAAASGDLNRAASIRNASRMAALRVRLSARKLKGRSGKRDGVASADGPSKALERGDPDSSDSALQPMEPIEDPGKGSAERGSGLPSDPLFWSGVGLVGAGLTSLGAAGIVELSLGGKWDAYRQAAQSGDTDSYDRLHTQITKSQTAGKAFLFSGLAATGLGLGALGAHLGRKQSPFNLRVRISPPIGSHPTAIGLRVLVVPP